MNDETDGEEMRSFCVSDRLAIIGQVIRVISPNIAKSLRVGLTPLTSGWVIYHPNQILNTEFYIAGESSSIDT